MKGRYWCGAQGTFCKQSICLLPTSIYIYILPYKVLQHTFVTARSSLFLHRMYTLVTESGYLGDGLPGGVIRFNSQGCDVSDTLHLR